jgi:hypothetical protein
VRTFPRITSCFLNPNSFEFVSHSSYTLASNFISMPPITALLHTTNDALRLGRALETLLPCSEFLVVDHHSTDATLRIAHAYGARILTAAANSRGHYLDHALYDWIFCLDPSESMTEQLQASLFEWCSLSSASVVNAPPSSVFVREQTDGDWRQNGAPQTRLVPRNWNAWDGYLPAHEPSSPTLEGVLLRIAFP